MENGVSYQSFLNDVLIPVMNRVGNKFTGGNLCIPDVPLENIVAMFKAMKEFNGR